MTAFFSKAKGQIPNIISALSRFFEGRIYPAVVAAAVLIGHISGLEFYLGISIGLMTALAFVICKTVKPLVPGLMMFIYIVNVNNAPGIPNFSDYYFVSWRLYVLIAASVLLVLALIYFIVRRIIPSVKGTKAPMLIPTALFSLSLLLNGIFGGYWSFRNVLFGAVQALIFFVLFYLLYYGLLGEDSERFIDYFIYVAVLTVIVLAGEMAHLLLSSDKVFNEEGAIIKEQILFGWGISNSFGCCASVLVPIPLLGASRTKSKTKAILYFAASIAAFVLSVLSLSRNALIFSAVALVASLTVCSIFGDEKKMFRIIAAIGIVLCAFVMAIFGEDIIRIVTEYMSRNMGDSGRFKLWRYCLDKFKEFPLFGGGFYAFADYEGIFSSFDAMPHMAHNTVVQLLGSMGIFGFLSYSIYRIASLLPIIKKPSFTKIMLAAPIVVLIAESLLDNFLFYIYMAFPYVILLALLHKIAGEESAAEKAAMCETSDNEE